MVTMIGAATALLAAYAWTQPGNSVQIFSLAAMLSLAATAAGMILGFIFAIPKTITGDRPLTGGDSVRRNTNLEQVSDWLTKVLIGAGVAWVGTARDTVSALIGRSGQYLGQGAELLFPSILLVFSITGFLLGYLWTGLHLPGQLADALGVADQHALLMMNAYLYESPPAGFRRVIEIGESYRASLENSSRYWRYMACAYGQQYAWFKNVEGGKDLVAIRKKALMAVKKAIAVDPSNTATLAPLLYAGDDSEENDLSAFRGDEEFERSLPANAANARDPGRAESTTKR